MITKEEVEILRKAKNVFRENCILDTGYCSDCDLEEFCENTPLRWDFSKIKGGFIITEEEYIILKNLKTPYKDFYIVRDELSGIILFRNKPFKFDQCWTHPEEGFTDFILSSDLFLCIECEDKEPKKVIDYIKEYEEYNEVE